MDETKTVADDIFANWTYAEKLKKDAMASGFAWEDREQLFYGIYKSAEEKAKSNYSTGELQSLVLDSACRVMAQMPTGRFSGMEDSTIAKVIAANLVYHEYILPNARSGGDYFTKQRQANIYSKVYGTMPAFIDYIESKTYTGPDLVLIHPRRFTPQPGKYSIADMDWCFVDTFVTKEWLEARSKASPDIWQADMIAELNTSTVDPTSLTTEEKKGGAEKKNIVLRNYFNRNGDWVLYEATSRKEIFLEKDYWPGIPMVEKQTIPVLDRYWGLSDYERGETPQKSIDALVRKYLEAVDKSIDPTTIIDPEDMVMSSVAVENKFWFAKDGKTQGPRVLENAPQGLATFQTTYQIMKANLMSLGASTDTSVPKTIDVGFGKTPEALKMQGDREGARDSWDRYMQEKFLEDCANMMMKVASKRGMGKVKIPSIEAALEKIRTAYPDQELDPFRNGIVGEELLSDLCVRYKVDEGSTAKKDDAGEKTMALLTMITKNPAIEQDILQSGKKINWSEAVKRLAIENGIQDWEKILVDSGVNPNATPGVGDAGGTVVPQPGQMVPPQGAPAIPMIPPAAVAQPQDVPQF